SRILKRLSPLACCNTAARCIPLSFFTVAIMAFELIKSPVDGDGWLRKNWQSITVVCAVGESSKIPGLATARSGRIFFRPVYRVRQGWIRCREDSFAPALSVVLLLT